MSLEMLVGRLVRPDPGQFHAWAVMLVGGLSGAGTPDDEDYEDE